MTDVDQQQSHPIRRGFFRWLWRRRLWCLILFVMLLVLVSVPLLMRQRNLSQVPDIDRPFSTASLLAPISEDDNAYPLLNEAFAAYQEPVSLDEEALAEESFDGWDAGDHLVDDYLKQNLEAMQLWREASRKSDYQEPPPGRRSIGDVNRGLMRKREFVRLALLRAEQLTAQGRTDEALPWWTAVFRMSGLVTRRGDVIHRMLGVAFHAMAAYRTEPWLAHPKTTKQHLQDLLATVTKAERLRAKWSETLKMEYLEIWENQNESIEDVLSTYRDAGAKPTFSRWDHWVRGEPEFSRRVSAFVLLNQVSYIDDPPRTRPSLLDGDLFNAPIVGVLPEKQLTSLQLMQLRQRSLFHTGSRIPLDAEQRYLARQRCLQIAIAAQIFHRDHERFPTKIAELVPELRSHQLDDPYAVVAKPLIYRQEGKGAVVYSRFHNGSDDGGKIVTFEEWSGGGDGPPDYGLRIRLGKSR